MSGGVGGGLREEAPYPVMLCHLTRNKNQ
jgi:hypothetical protein